MRKNISTLIALLSNVIPFVRAEVESFDAVLRGDPNALLNLMQRRVDLIFSKLAPRKERDELISETFLECSSRLNELRAIEQFHYWLICASLNALRKVRRFENNSFKKIDMSRLSDLQMLKDPTPVAQASKNEEQRMLIQAIEQLPEQESILCQKIYREYLDKKTVAQEMGVTVRTIQRKVRKLHKKIQGIVQK